MTTETPSGHSWYAANAVKLNLYQVGRSHVLVASQTVLRVPNKTMHGVPKSLGASAA